MDERVEITDAPQPLLPHPDAPITAHANSYAKAGEAEIRQAPRRKAALIWAALSYICAIVPIVLFVSIYSINPIVPLFDRDAKLLPMGWVVIILVYSSLLFSIISNVMTRGNDESVPTSNRRNYAFERLSLVISVVAVLLQAAIQYIANMLRGL